MTNNEATTNGNFDHLPCPLCGEHCCDGNFELALLRAGGEGSKMSGPCPECGAHITIRKAARGRLVAIAKPPKGSTP